MQHAGGMLLPPVQKLVATSIFCPGKGRKCTSRPVARTAEHRAAFRNQSKHLYRALPHVRGCKMYLLLETMQCIINTSAVYFLKAGFVATGKKQIPRHIRTSHP
jgi:hypothetical protein